MGSEMCIRDRLQQREEQECVCTPLEGPTAAATPRQDNIVTTPTGVGAATAAVATAAARGSCGTPDAVWEEEGSQAGTRAQPDNDLIRPQTRVQIRARRPVQPTLFMIIFLWLLLPGVESFVDGGPTQTTCLECHDNQETRYAHGGVRGTIQWGNNWGSQIIDHYGFPSAAGIDNKIMTDKESYGTLACNCACVTLSLIHI